MMMEEKEILVVLVAREIRKTFEKAIRFFPGREREAALLILEIVQEACELLKSQVE